MRVVVAFPLTLALSPAGERESTDTAVETYMLPECVIMVISANC